LTLYSSCLAGRRINGVAIRRSGFEIHAAFGHAAAHECAVAGLSSAEEHACGSTTDVHVIPSGDAANARSFLGSEVVYAHVTGKQNPSLTWLSSPMQKLVKLPSSLCFAHLNSAARAGLSLLLDADRGGQGTHACNLVNSPFWVPLSPG
jgi:hypothetical protein